MNISEFPLIEYDLIYEAKSKSILDYLEQQGISLRFTGKNYVCHSPFSEDRNPSFSVSADGAVFYDFSNGFGGDIVTLVAVMYDISTVDAVRHICGIDLKKVDPVKRASRVKPPFDILNYLLFDDVEDVLMYADKRKFSMNSFIPAYYFMIDELTTAYEKIPGCGFVHTDEYSNICGIKIRSAVDKGPRFYSRGKSHFFFLENVDITAPEPPTLYIVESETSASTFFRYLTESGVNCVVVSYGGVDNVPKAPPYVPYKWDHLHKRRSIIDFDGNPEAYAKRIRKYEPTGASPIMLELPHGEDLNTLYVSGNIKYFEDQLIRN